VVELTDTFCHRRLNEEYAALCRSAAAALARKRPSPLVRGRLEIWACAIVYALGTVNFLFDRSQQPSLSAEELCGAFGVSKRSGANKAKQVRDLLDMSQFEATWFLPVELPTTPSCGRLKSMVSLWMHATLPREFQKIAYRKGLIPYIPADRQGK